MKDGLIILAAVVQAGAALAIVYFTFRVVAANDRMAAANEAMIQEMRAEREARRQERSWEAADRLMQALPTAQDLWQEEKTSEAWNAWSPAYLYNRDVLADEHLRDCVRRFSKLLRLAASHPQMLLDDGGNKASTAYRLSLAAESLGRKLDAHRRGEAPGPCNLPHRSRAWEFLVAPRGSISDEDDMAPFTASLDQA